MEDTKAYTLEELLDQLHQQKEVHPEVTLKMLKANDAAMYPLDLMGISVSKRSMSLIRGFTEMIRQENFICAAPLLRMQLDNSLRFYASFLVEDPHDLARQFAEGKLIKDFKEKGTNQRFSDHLLVQRLAEHHPWITEVYKKACGYVHLSDLHLFNTLGKKDEEKGLGVIISDSDSFITDKERLEAVYIMFRLTTIVLWLLHSWTITKETPDTKQWKEKHGPGTGYKK
jgi:hypothetical protein